MPLYVEILGAIVRWLLTLVGGYLIAHHVITASQADRLTTDVAYHAMLAAPVLFALAWSIWQKYSKAAALRLATLFGASGGETRW